MVAVKSLASVLVSYINMKYTLARNVPTFPTNYHKELTQCTDTPGQFTLPCPPELTGRRCTTQKSMERIQMFSDSVLSPIPIRFHQPQDSKSGGTSNSSREATLPDSYTSKASSSDER